MSNSIKEIQKILEAKFDGVMDLPDRDFLRVVTMGDVVDVMCEGTAEEILNSLKQFVAHAREAFQNACDTDQEKVRFAETNLGIMIELCDVALEARAETSRTKIETDC